MILSGVSRGLKRPKIAACMVRASYILHMPIQGTSPYLLLAVRMAYLVQDRSIQQAPPVSTTV